MWSVSYRKYDKAPINSITYNCHAFYVHYIPESNIGRASKHILQNVMFTLKEIYFLQAEISPFCLTVGRGWLIWQNFSPQSPERIQAQPGPPNQLRPQQQQMLYQTGVHEARPSPTSNMVCSQCATFNVCSVCASQWVSIGIRNKLI